MTTPTHRLTLTSQRLTLAVTTLRERVYRYLPHSPVAVARFEDDLAAIEAAARALALESGRDGWLKAAATYRVAQVTAMTDWQVAHEAAVAERTVRR